MNYVQILNEENYILIFLRRAGHTMDEYNKGQVGLRPLACYHLQNIYVMFIHFNYLHYIFKFKKILKMYSCFLQVFQVLILTNGSVCGCLLIN